MRAGQLEAPLLAWVAIVIGACLLSGCQQESEQSPSQTPVVNTAQPSAPDSDTAAPGFVKRYVELRDQAAERLNRDTHAFCASIEHLVARPDQSSLQKARSSWNYAHHAYLSWQTFDFGVRDKKQAVRQARLIDAWPILAGYIDYTAEHPGSGIVFDTTVELDLENLLEQHQLTDPSEVSVGFHALEFLLWGEVEGSRRTAADFSVEEAAKEPDAEVIRRRNTYLGTLCLALENAARQVSTSDKRKDFPPAKVVAGLAEVLAELVLEQRIVAHIKARNPDPECGFSDTPMCGIQPITESLRQIFLEARDPESPDTIVAYVRQHQDLFGTELEPATQHAISALDSLSDPAQRDDLFAAEALSRTWLAEIRTLQRALARARSAALATP